MILHTLEVNLEVNFYDMLLFLILLLLSSSLFVQIYVNDLFYILMCNKIVYLLLLMFLHIWDSSLTAPFLFGTVEYIDNFLFIKIYNIWAENIFRQHRRIFLGGVYFFWRNGTTNSIKEKFLRYWMYGAVSEESQIWRNINNNK